MKDFLKFAAIAAAGYLVGFYETKYKTSMALIKILTEKNQEDSEEKTEEEAQTSFFLFLGMMVKGKLGNHQFHQVRVA